MRNFLAIFLLFTLIIIDNSSKMSLKGLNMRIGLSNLNPLRMVIFHLSRQILLVKTEDLFKRLDDLFVFLYPVGSTFSLMIQ